MRENIFLLRFDWPLWNRVLQQLKRKFFLQCATIRPPPSSPGLDWEKSVSCEKCSSKEFKFENNWPLGTKTTKIHNNMWTAVKNLSCDFWKKVQIMLDFTTFHSIFVPTLFITDRNIKQLLTKYSGHSQRSNYSVNLLHVVCKKQA